MCRRSPGRAKSKVKSSCKGAARTQRRARPGGRGAERGARKQTPRPALDKRRKSHLQITGRARGWQPANEKQDVGERFERLIRKTQRQQMNTERCSTPVTVTETRMRTPRHGTPGGIATFRDKEPRAGEHFGRCF